MTSGERPKATPTLDELAEELLKSGTEKWEGYTEAKFDIKGELTDLHIELGRKFPELFPKLNEPLPEELEYAKRMDVVPVIFKGLPEDGRISIFRSDYRPRHDYDFYELTVSLLYKDKNAGYWSLTFGKNSPDPGIFRHIKISGREEMGYADIGQGQAFSRRVNADEDFAQIVSSFTGDLIT